MRPKPRKGSANFDRNKVKPKLTVTLPTATMISKCRKFIVLVGTGKDKGKLRIKGVSGKDAKGADARDFKNHVIIRFGHVPRFGDEIFDAERFPLRRINDDEYEVDTGMELVPEQAAAA